MSSGIKQLLQFFSLSCLLSWVIWLPLYLPFWGIHGLPVVPYQHALGATGPFMAAIIMTFFLNGKKGVTLLTKRLFKPAKLLWLLIALLSPLLLLLLSLVIHFFFNAVPVNLSGVGLTNEFPAFSPPVYFLYSLIFFGYGEEAGWKGFALPRLQQHFNAFVSGLVFTVFWALWHWPLFLFRPGYISMDIAGMAGWIFSLVTGSILLTWLFNSSRGSIMACAVFHGAIDIVFVSDQPDTRIINYLGMLITCWGIITVLVFGYKHLSHHARIKRLL